jgi:hypothetical protein
MFRYADLGGRIDEWSRDPGFPAALGDPHPDALAIEARVLALDRFGGLIFDSDAGLLIGVEGFAPGRERADQWSPPAMDVAAIVAHASTMMVGLVANHARLRSRPLVITDMPRPCRVMAPYSAHPLVVRDDMVASKFDRLGDGRGADVLYLAQVPVSAFTSRGKPGWPIGSYCPLRWEPKPEEIVRDRAEYAVWRAALEVLAGELAGMLASIAVLAPSAPWRPWAGETDLGKPPALFEGLRREPHRRGDRALQRARREGRKPAPREPGAPPPASDPPKASERTKR